MMSTTPYDQDMETLSALFDGELQGDAARFAIKRLGHDVRWRQALGNWQQVGDALRGQAGMPAPGDFAARVLAAVSAEPAAVAASMPSAAASSAATSAAARIPTPARRKWIGGAALAASVAMVAMFVARPFSQDAANTPGPAATEFAAAPSAPIDGPAPGEAAPSAPDAAMQIGAAALAVAEVPRRAGERRSRGQSQRAALRAPMRQPSPAVANAAPGTAMAVAEPLQSPSSVNPFHPQHPEIVSRPWPRAVLPAASATGSYTASYGSGTLGSPSFYPFEPRLPNTTEAAPAPINLDDLQP